jgi:hypothetical protein
MENIEKKERTTERCTAKKRIEHWKQGSIKKHNQRKKKHFVFS